VRILFCTAEAPVPPVNGFRLQLIHLCRELAKRHEVSVLTFAPDPPGEPPPGVELITVKAPPVGGLANRVSAHLRGTVHGVPSSIGRFGVPMEREVRRLLETRSFDVVHVTNGSMASLGDIVAPIPAIIALLDAWHVNVEAERMVAPLALRPLYRLEERRVRRFCAHAFRSFGRAIMVTEQDAVAARELDPTLRIEAIPNGVDGEEFAPNPSVEPEPGHIVFTGAMHWAPNVNAARSLALEILPRVRAVRPDARLSLVGRSPSSDVLELGELEGVHVTGEVPDVRPWLWSAEAYACPMWTGTGIKNKLLEALACARPVAATPLACQGIRVADGREVLVAGSEQDMADALVRLLGDAELRARLARGGREHVRRYHAWERVAAEYERVYAEVIAEA